MLTAAIKDSHFVWPNKTLRLFELILFSIMETRQKKNLTAAHLKEVLTKITPSKMTKGAQFDANN